LEKELIISKGTKETHIALLENKKLVELHNQKPISGLAVGDIYLGKISKLLPGLNAAFVDIGQKEKDAFLHYTDLGPKLRSLLKFTNNGISGGQKDGMLKDFQIEADIQKAPAGKIPQVLKKGQLVLVQILKEPISTKGPRLCCEITIASRYLVLTPFSNTIAISKKIGTEQERARLKQLLENLRPHNFGFIVRTAADGCTVAELHEDINELMDKWNHIFKELHNANDPIKCLSEGNKTQTIIRDFWNDSFSRVVVDSKSLFDQVSEELERVAPGKKDLVKLHPGPRPLFDHYGVTRQIKASFGKTSTMASGAYIVIEHTEAMHVIDVNSGHKMSSGDQEENAMRVNIEAAEEIARQLRLRDIGGIIIVDFIDMRNVDNRNKLHLDMKQFMSGDNAKHTVLPLSKFGLMQITRERVRPQVNIVTAERCPTCNGSGKIQSSLLVTDEIKRDLDFIMSSQRPAKLTLIAHPFVQAYLCKGWFFNSIQMKWWREYKKWIKIQSDNNFALTSYKFFNENNDEIRLT
jgi:ribonuclease G